MSYNNGRNGIYVQSSDYLMLNNLDIFKTVTIADTIYELQIGQGLGVSSIGVTWGIHPPEKLASIHPSAIAATIVDLKNLLI